MSRVHTLSHAEASHEDVSVKLRHGMRAWRYKRALLGQKATYKCSRRRNTEGAATRTCDSNKQGADSCKRTCGAPRLNQCKFNYLATRCVQLRQCTHHGVRLAAKQGIFVSMPQSRNLNSFRKYPSAG